MGTTKWLKCENCCAFLSFYLTFCNKLQDNMLKKRKFLLIFLVVCDKLVNFAHHLKKD